MQYQSFERLKELHPRKSPHLLLSQAILSDNPILYEKIEKGAAVSRQEVVLLLAEVVKFLQLIDKSQQILSPSLSVDLAWHELILCTKYYGDFCQYHFGKMIHHHPGKGQADHRLQFVQCLRLYIVLIGEPPSAYWGKEAAALWQDSQCEGS